MNNEEMTRKCPHGRACDDWCPECEIEERDDIMKRQEAEIERLRSMATDTERLDYLSLQWKGTDACCDIHCKCGAHLHFDGFFLYAFQCPHCKQIYETGSHVPIYAVSETECHIKVIEPDDDFETEKDAP